MPAEAICAATTAFFAAMPAWNGFAMVPNCTLVPDAMLTPKPMALRMASSLSPSSRAQAAAAPMVPTVEVECQPLS
jgi:hypothetical protein